MKRKLLLWTELAVLFCGLPLAAAVTDLQPFRLSLLLGGTAYAVWTMRHETRVSWMLTSRVTIGIGVRFPLIAGFLGLMVWKFMPDLLFNLPRQRFTLWLIIMAAYPLLSAIPQEYVYRRFFYARYGHLLPARIMDALNVVLFGGLHLLYGNWQAVVLATLGGAVFTCNWRRSNSMASVSLEHALYGMWIFTVGLGRFFYR